MSKIKVVRELVYEGDSVDVSSNLRESWFKHLNDITLYDPRTKDLPRLSITSRIVSWERVKERRSVVETIGGHRESLALPAAIPIGATIKVTWEWEE